jgi:hypothetical protein
MKILCLAVLLLTSSSVVDAKNPKSPKASPPVCPSPFTILTAKHKNNLVVDYKHYLVRASDPI